jgi:hypothetical protein
MRTRMYGGVTGKAGDSLPMSMRLVAITIKMEPLTKPLAFSPA